MTHGAEVGVDWANGLVLHENDAEWHPWDEAVYGPCPVVDDAPLVCDNCGVETDERYKVAVYDDENVHTADEGWCGDCVAECPEPSEAAI